METNVGLFFEQRYGESRSAAIDSWRASASPTIPPPAIPTESPSPRPRYLLADLCKAPAHLRTPRSPVRADLLDSREPHR